MNRVGIGDIELYVPSPLIDLKRIVERRVEEDRRLARHLDRACRVTGQRAIRFPGPGEDAATLAASAALPLFEAGRLDAGAVRHLGVGTESGLDHSKPLSAYAQGMLRDSGVPLPSALSSFQTQHACAGGTAA